MVGIYSAHFIIKNKPGLNIEFKVIQCKRKSKKKKSIQEIQVYFFFNQCSLKPVEYKKNPQK